MSDQVRLEYPIIFEMVGNLNFRFDAVKALRDMEKFTREVGGYPFLYADIFMTRKEFEDMFDLTGTVTGGPKICETLFTTCIQGGCGSWC